MSARATRRRQRADVGKTINRVSSYLFSFLLILGIWEGARVLFDIPKYLVPSVAAVAETLIVERGQLLEETWITFQEAALGYLLAIATAIPTAILVTYSLIARRIVYPILVVSQVIPKIAIAPLLIVWLGFGVFPKILVAFLVSFFAIVVSTATGLNEIEPKMIHLARSMGAGTWGTFLRVRLPSALPVFFGGLKVGVTLAVIGAIVGEFVGSGQGLGHLTVIAMGSLRVDLVFAAIIMMSLVGVFMYLIVEVTERLLVPWGKGKRIEEIQSAS